MRDAYDIFYTAVTKKMIYYTAEDISTIMDSNLESGKMGIKNIRKWKK